MYRHKWLVHRMYMSKVTPRFRRGAYRKTFLREWREYRGRTLEEAAEAIGMTHASLSRIERALQPYSQEMLEALAEYYAADVASLLIRNPLDPEGIWSIWDQAKPAEREQIVNVARALVKTGT